MRDPFIPIVSVIGTLVAIAAIEKGVPAPIVLACVVAFVLGLSRLRSNYVSRSHAVRIGDLRETMPDDFPSVAVVAGIRAPVQFEGTGMLEVIGTRAVFSSTPDFLKTGSYKNVKTDITFNFTVPTAAELKTFESPRSAKYSMDWIALTGLDVDTVMICVGTAGADAEASRTMTKRLSKCCAASRSELSSEVSRRASTAACHFERLVAFSCKGRGFCPSCDVAQARAASVMRRAAPSPSFSAVNDTAWLEQRRLCHAQLERAAGFSG